jgi:integrase
MTDIQLPDEQEVSRRLSVSVNTLRYWRASGDGPNYVKLGRLVRYDAVALEKLAGIPESVVLYCARHRFSTDAMEGTGNVMAVMDAMGHQSVNTARIYNHSNVRQITEAIERRNQLLGAPVGSCAKAGHKSGHSRLKRPCQEMCK